MHVQIHHSQRQHNNAMYICKPLPGMLIFKLHVFTEDKIATLNKYTTCIFKNLNKKLTYLQPLHRAYARLHYINTYKKTKTKKPVSCHCHIII